MPWSLQSQELGAEAWETGGEEVMFCSGYLGIPETGRIKPLKSTDNDQLTQPQLSGPLFLSEVVPLVHPTGPGYPACCKLLDVSNDEADSDDESVGSGGGDRLDLVVRHHAVVVLHEDGAPLGELGARLVTLALLLCPLQEDVLAGQAGRHQGACQQIKPKGQKAESWKLLEI